ncbi:MAG: hypothetical protein KF862_14875 [Chitinophagaceae bacterium]|nr:hypothetical protein [Chitinophagaceae bacterium]
MNKIKTSLYMMLAAAILAAGFSSCTKELDLDEETLIALEKQEKMKKLDELFDLAFTDPAKAETDYYQFYTTELLTETQNFVVDNDVRMRNTFTDLAIRLNTNFEKIKALPGSSSLFDLYKVKYDNWILNRSLIGEIPNQIRRGEKLEKFESKVDEVSAYFQAQVDAFKAKNPVDQNILNKQWTAFKFIVKPDFSAYFIMNYDFKFLANGGLDINNFYLFPMYNLKSVEAGGYTSFEESTNFSQDLADIQLSPASYAVYNNKIFFYFHFKASPNAADGKLNREWCYEFDYTTEENTLTLSNPRVMYLMNPLFYQAGYGDKHYELLYFDALREPVILTAQ